MKVSTREVRVRNPRGIHCRIATRLSEIVAGHDARLRMIYNNEPADCASILDILSLAVVHGTLVGFSASGPEAEKVLAAVEHLLSQTEDP